jgi:hypothetical protein
MHDLRMTRGEEESNICQVILGGGRIFGARRRRGSLRGTCLSRLIDQSRPTFSFADQAIYYHRKSRSRYVLLCEAL